MKKLLIEQISTIQVPKIQLTENISLNNGRLIVKGVIQRADAPNQNGRIYSKKILERERQKYFKKIKEKRAYGELDHPESNTINLKNVSHVMANDIEWDGNDMIGYSEILNTPSGRILRELLDAGCTVGISSRGLGSTEPIREGEFSNYEEIQDDFELICWDFVSDPSTHEAYMNPLNESRLIGERKYQQKHQQVHKLITDIICELSGVCCLQN